ncbi:hypothetical protein CRM22_007611 [Opisthorchis felineus]|uniref:dihydropyrimidinase n=1 Tax=Opisthorchis felineus TaxID=147828 RepID=A0A4S2LF22_OPIFE|nr:hypothetical protein CRM22_007611 [Opisthorchis felineus]
MSHRRESGAVPPWVIPEPAPRKTLTTSPQTQQSEPRTPSVAGDVRPKRRVSFGEAEETPYIYACGHMGDVPNAGKKKQCLHIIGGEIVNSDCIQKADLLIENGKIISIGKKLDVPRGTGTIDASGLLIMPGGVDIATYIQNEMFDYREEDYTNTTKEAVLGGTTTIVDTVICPRGEYPIDVLCKQKSRTQAAKLWCNVIYRVGLLELNDVILDQMEPLVKQHHVSSFLFFVSSPDAACRPVQAGISPANLKNALHRCRQLGVLALVRNASVPVNQTSKCEQEFPLDAVEEKVHLSILHAAGSANCPILLTSPTGLNSVEETAKSRRRVPPVHAYVSIAPSSLLPSTTNGMQRSSQFLSPLATGDIAAISSDQAGTNHPKGSARLGAIGQRLVAVWEASVPTGWLDASGFVRVVSTNAARYTGQYPNKGRISAGSDADLVLWPSDSLTQPGTGRPALVLLRGMIVAREGKLADSSMNVGPCITIDGIPQDVADPEPLGEVLACEPFPMTVYSVVLATDRLRRRYQASMDNDTWSMGALQNEVNTPAKSTPSAEPSGTKSSTQPTASPTLVTNLQQTPENLSGVRMVHGHRDLHASGFSLSGAQVDDNQPHRSGIRTSQPPGGQSRNPLW